MTFLLSFSFPSSHFTSSTLPDLQHHAFTSPPSSPNSPSPSPASLSQVTRYVCTNLHFRFCISCPCFRAFLGGHLTTGLGSAFCFLCLCFFVLFFGSRPFGLGEVFLGLFFLRALALEFGVFAFPLVLYLVSGGWSAVMITVSHTKVGDSLHSLGMPFGETDLCCEHVPHSRTEI